MHTYMHACRHTKQNNTSIYTYMCMYVCVYIYIYMYTHMYTCIHIRVRSLPSRRRTFVVFLSCAIYTHTPARKSSTNFQLYYFVIQICSTNWLGHGHGYKWHSSVPVLLALQLALHLITVLLVL